MKLLTVTVPCYNSAEYMEKCVDSMLAEKERIEIIIVDDGSTDNTGEIADRYAKEYPATVKVIHQENGGHGEGINVGVANATGKYFKVLDSDDVMSDDFAAFLDKLEELERDGGVDLFVTNYYYVHTDGIADRSICYKDVLPSDRIFGWSDIKRFKIHQLLTIHSSTFRTELMRDFAEPLPKHVFYEDNLMVYRNLPKVEKMYYMDIDLYRYSIGREDQSVQESIMRKRYTHQIFIAEHCFSAYRLDAVVNKKLRKYLRHELFVLFAIAVLNARLNKNREADVALRDMWKKCISLDSKWGRHFRYRTPLVFISLPGSAGRLFSEFIYRLANKIVRFN